MQIRVMAVLRFTRTSPYATNTSATVAWILSASSQAARRLTSEKVNPESFSHHTKRQQTPQKQQRTDYAMPGGKKTARNHGARMRQGRTSLLTHVRLQLPNTSLSAAASTAKRQGRAGDPFEGVCKGKQRSIFENSSGTSSLTHHPDAAYVVGSLVASAARL